jgi:hypothetical protein
MDVTVESFLKDFKARVEMKADNAQPRLLAELKK